MTYEDGDGVCIGDKPSVVEGWALWSVAPYPFPDGFQHSWISIQEQLYH